MRVGTGGSLAFETGSLYDEDELDLALETFQRNLEDAFDAPDGGQPTKRQSSHAMDCEDENLTPAVLR